MFKLRLSHVVLPVIIGAVSLLSGCQSLTTTYPPLSHDGLELVGTEPLDAIYRKPGIELSNYQRVKISDCSVAFRKNWQRDQNSVNRDISRRVTAGDMDKIRAKLGAMCHEVFMEELGKDSTYQVTEESGEDVLELKPSIIDLDINAPDTMSVGRSRSYTTSAGSMKLYLEAHDSVSGELLARVIDRRRASDTGQLEWTNSVTNAREAKLILRRWGAILHDMLESTR